MSLLGEEVVEEWLNRNGYFTIRGIKVGVDEIPSGGERRARPFINAAPSRSPAQHRLGAARRHRLHTEELLGTAVHQHPEPRLQLTVDCAAASERIPLVEQARRVGAANPARLGDLGGCQSEQHHKRLEFPPVGVGNLATAGADVTRSNAIEDGSRGIVGGVRVLDHQPR